MSNGLISSIFALISVFEIADPLCHSIVNVSLSISTLSLLSLKTNSALGLIACIDLVIISNLLMTNYLLITESPTKAKKIQSFLPKEYLVKSSCGHIRDLEKKKTKRYGNPGDFGIHVEKNFKPKYVVLSDKKDIVNQLKGYSKNRTVIFAADDDR